MYVYIWLYILFIRTIEYFHPIYNMRRNILRPKTTYNALIA